MHACASSGGASSKRVDHHPSSGICLGVLPFENDFRTLFLVSLSSCFMVIALRLAEAKIRRSCPTSSAQVRLMASCDRWPRIRHFKPPEKPQESEGKGLLALNQLRSRHHGINGTITLDKWRFLPEQAKQFFVEGAAACHQGSGSAGILSNGCGDVVDAVASKSSTVHFWCVSKSANRGQKAVCNHSVPRLLEPSVHGSPAKAMPLAEPSVPPLLANSPPKSQACPRRWASALRTKLHGPMSHAVEAHCGRC